MDLRRIILSVSVLAILILVAVHDVEARGSRTSSRARSRKPTSKKSSKSDGAKTKSRTEPKVKTFHSSVKRSDITTKQKPFNQRFTSVAASAVIIHTVQRNIIYGKRYRPYYDSSNIEIPKDRALRMKTERYYVQTRNGSRCGSNASRLVQYNETDIFNVATKITYLRAKNVTGDLKTIQPVEMSDPKRTNLTVSAEALDDYVVHFRILVTFNNSILTNSPPSPTTTLASPWNSTMPSPRNTTSSLSSNSTADDLNNCKVMVYEAEAYVVEIAAGSVALKTKENFVFILSAMFLSLIAIN